MYVENFVRNLRDRHGVFERLVIRFRSSKLLIVRDKDDAYVVITSQSVDILHCGFYLQIVTLGVSAYPEIVKVVDYHQFASFRYEVANQWSELLDAHLLLRIGFYVHNVFVTCRKHFYRFIDFLFERIRFDIVCHKFAFRIIRQSGFLSDTSYRIVQVVLALVLMPVFKNETSYLDSLP